MGLNRKRVFIVVGFLLAGAASAAALIAWSYRRGERAESLMAAVKSNLDAHRFDAARIEAEKLVRIASNDANAHLFLAKALLAGRDPGAIKTTEADALRAVRSLMTAVRINGALTEAQRMVLSYYAGQRNYPEAMPFAQEVIRSTPEDAQANFILARALVQLGRPLEARKHLERLMADEKKQLRPRTAALAAAVGEGLGKEGTAFVTQAEESLGAYIREKAAFNALDDRISLVELRCWKAHRAPTPANVVREQLTAAVADLAKLVKDERSNDMLPGFVLDAVKQILPRDRMNRPELQPIVKDLQEAIDRVTTETFTVAVDRKILDPRLYTAYGERLRDKGKEDEAATIVKQGLDNAKNASELVKREFGVCELWLAKHFLAQKRKQDARPHIESLIAHSDWKPWGQLMLGYSLVLEDKFEQAAPPLQEAVAKLGGNNGAAHALYGLCMLRRGYVMQGREHLERGKALGADGAQFRAWLTLALAEAGENQAALQMAKDIIGAAGGKAEAVSGVSKALEGELRMRTGDFDGAEKCLAEALQRTDPKLRSAVRLSQAQLRIAKKDWPRAKAILDEVKQDENFAYRAFATEVRWLQQNDRGAEAVQVLTDARQRFPNNGLLLAIQINDLTTSKKFDDARQVLLEERKRQPDKELPFLLLAEVFESAKKPEQAVKVLEEAAKQFPKEASIKLRLADKLIERGRTVEAGPFLAELEGDANVNPSAIAYLKARRAVKEGDQERANAIIEEGFKRDPYNSSLAMLKAQQDALKGRIGQAKDILENVVDGGQGRRQPIAMLFDAYIAEGNVAKAAQLLRDQEARGQPEVVSVLRRKLVRLLAQREQNAELERELETMLAERPSETDVALAVNLYQGIKQEDKAKRIINEALARAPESPILNEVNIALMLDRNEHAAAHHKIADDLFRKQAFLKNPTIHALRARAFIATDELGEALKAVTFGLEPHKAAGNPALAALKVQVLLRMKRDSDADAFAVQMKKDFAYLPPAKYLLARAYEALGQTEKAFALLTELAKADPSDANAAHHYLRLLISRGQFGDLEPSIERFITANANANKQGAKENPLLLGVLAEYHATRGDVPKARAVLARLEKTQDGGVVVPYLRGVVAFAEGKLADAEKALQLAMTDPSGHIPSTFLMAQIRASEGRLDDSLRLLGRIAKSADSPAAVPLLRASLMVRTGKFEEAETACRDYLKLNPSARPFRQLLTQVLVHRGTDASKQEALQIAETSLEQGVDNPLDFEVFLKVLMTAGRTDKALQIIASRAVQKNRPELILAGGRACYSAGQFRESERYAKKLVIDEPHNLNAKLLLGDSLMKIGEASDPRNQVEQTDVFEKAAIQYRDVLKAQPTNMIAANNLAWVIGVHLGRPHRALEELQSAFKGSLSETNRALPAEVLDTIGFLHLKMDHYSDAQKYLEEAATRKPTSAEIQVHLAEAYIKQGRGERAKQALEKAKSLDATGDFSKDIQRLNASR